MNAKSDLACSSYGKKSTQRFNRKIYMKQATNKTNIKTNDKLQRTLKQIDSVCVNLIALDISVRRISHKPFLPSQVLTKNMLTESYKTITVPVITCRSENWSITLQEVNRLKELEIRSKKNTF